MKQLVFIGMLVFLSSSITLAQDFCKGDFNYNGSVAAEDVELFLEDFGRNEFNNPCPSDGPTPPPRTGQTTSYATGDDGDLEKGVALVKPRFTDNLDGTVTDNQTGLIWLKIANCFGFRKWNLAISDSNGLASGSCGLTDGSNSGDWRLPNKRELISLTHDGYYEPTLSNTAGTAQWSEGDTFTSVQSSQYWSSTGFATSSDYAWSVNMRSGYVLSYDKYSSLYVWPVRGGH
jgi:hypothetical protein